MKLIALTQGQFAKVDDADFAELSKYKWYACWSKSTKSFYAQRNVWEFDTKKAHVQLMHRAITNPAKKMVVDHADHDTLNNQRLNLRVCTYSQNLSNRRGPQEKSSTGIRGVTADKRRGTYFARISLNGKSIHLGSFKTKEDAGSAYAVANAKYFGEFGGQI